MLIETARGPVESTELGVTLAHEHLCILTDGVATAFPRLIDREGIVARGVDILGQVAEWGGQSIIDLTVLGLGREISIIGDIARRSPVHVVVASGMYIFDEVPKYFASRPIEVGTYWFAPIDDPAPGGESFMDLYNRVKGAIDRINAAHTGGDVVVVAHGGTIKAALGVALGNQPERGLAFTIDNVSVTRLDHYASPGQGSWRLPMLNQQPWIADIAHAAMHQPAGPEVATASKLA